MSAKIAIAAPSPRTSVVDAVMVKAGERRRDLQAGRAKVERSIGPRGSNGLRSRWDPMAYAEVGRSVSIADLARRSLSVTCKNLDELRRITLPFPFLSRASAVRA